MFRFHSKGQLPRHNNSDPTYVLQSRKSIYCVHREVMNIHRGPDSSVPTKSCILGFRFKEHAERMRLVLNGYQRQGRVIDGTVRDGVMNIDDSLQGRPISNLDIHSLRLEDVEKRCLMNYLDLWLVADIAPIKARYAPDSMSKLVDSVNSVDSDCTDTLDTLPSWRFDVYEYITSEPPHRSYINHQLERLLRNVH